MSGEALIEKRRLAPPPGEDFWVFAYGSLMWRPGFPFRESQPALLRGYHRAFCVFSFHYRGTERRPGLVLGLDRGGSCRGRAFRIAATDGRSVADYLHEREMITGVYNPRWLPVEIPGRRVIAATYLVDPGHEQYAGKLGDAAAVRLILQGQGRSGSNLEYLENTVRHLDELGIADCPLHRLLRLAEQQAKTGTGAKAKGRRRAT
ncbi:MAG: gamma-glutamylcyclotransferase [Dongiaceae bacterium]